MRTVGIGAKQKVSDDADTLKKQIEELKAKLAEATEYAEAKDKQIEELEAKLAETEKPAAKTAAKSK